MPALNTTTELFFFAALLLVTLATGVLLVVRRSRRQARATVALADAVEQNLHLPLSLHPVIDPDICIGSGSCLEACPEGDILGMVDGKAKLITGSNCIGHGKCALECPVSAIKLVFGTSERGVELPEVDTFFESSRAGVHIVGELGGMGLIKNAITQGLQVAEHLAAGLRGRASEGMVDVAVVGSGPAGLATAVGLRAAGKSFRVLEQGALGGTIANYPRQKVVMTEKVTLPLYGKFGKALVSKEELLETWGKVTAKAEISVEEGTKVLGLEGADGAFTVQTSVGPVRARKVVLATGRRGSPRKLGVPGEQLPKVSYGLVDPEQYEGTQVLIVGGGDSALEAAIALAEKSDAGVVISYRSAAFAKCRDSNRKQIEALAASGRVKIAFSSEVKEIHPDRVTLSLGGQLRSLKNDFVIVQAGGELPLEFLRALGIALRRHHGTGLPSAADLPPTAKAKRGSAGVSREQQRDRRLALGLFTLGALIVATLTVVGWDYYRLPRLARLRSPLHLALRPAGVWGHGIGIVSTAVMLSNFLYAVRKRWRLLKGASTIRRWLTFHMFVGFLSPVVIAFHAAFQSNNLLASATAGSLSVVVLTGVVGRFIYGLVPTQDGRTVAYADLSGRWQRLRTRVEPMLAQVKDPESVRVVLQEATAEPRQGSLLTLFSRMPVEAVARWWRLRRIRPLFPDAASFEDFRTAFARLVNLRRQVGFYRSLKRLLAGWRVFHVTLAVLLVGMITAHIGVSLYLGYGWIFF